MRFGISSLICALVAGGATGEAGLNPWPGDAGAAVAASALSGWYASADTAADRVELRGVRGELLRAISRAELQGLLPWMTLDASGDGPSALAFTDSGRSLFILVHDTETAPDGLGDDAIVRYDTALDQLTVFARGAFASTVNGAAPVSLHHFRGRLFVGTESSGLLAYRAERNDTAAFVPSVSALGSAVSGLATDRASGVLYAVSGGALLRATLAIQPLSFVAVGPLGDARGLGHSRHFGGDSPGLYALTREAGQSVVRRIPDGQALGLQAFAPETAFADGVELEGLATTACGRMLLGGAGGVWLLEGDADPRLGFEDWLRDEFARVVSFATGLIAPDGEPDGWVIDADVRTGWTRFHPATPDAAGWAVLLLLMDEHLNGDGAARERVRTILERYAGLAPGPGPSASADGQIRHWIDPLTGGVKPGWNPEFATLSTMKIVLAADRARAMYHDDPAIVAAAGAIIDRVTNWDGYIQPLTDALYFVALPGGGPDPFSGGGGFHEGIIYIEQAAAFGSAGPAFARWLDRSRWPTASFVNLLPVTTNIPGQHQAAFLSLYPSLVQREFRASPSWRAHLRNLLGSFGAWTDDAGPALMTVFSAGSTKPEWGGYHADSLSDHPGDVTTLPSLMAFAGTLGTPPAVGAYHAYRQGARQTFAGGTSILYRRSRVDPSFSANDAGLPDVALGALGLVELIRPGSIDAVLARVYGAIPCPADLAPPFGVLDLADLNAFVAAFLAEDPVADLTPPFGVFDLGDLGAFIDSFVSGCP
jgi:hypothetical protein